MRYGWMTVGGVGAALALSGCGREVAGGPSVHARIGPDGGILSSYDSVLTIAILPGALDTTIDFFVEPSATPPDVFGPAYRVDPNPQLHLDATVTYRFNLPEERAAVVAVDPVDFAGGDARWTLLPRIDVDTGDKLVKGRDSQISLFYGLIDDGPLLSDDGNDDLGGTTGLDGGPGPGPGPGSTPDSTAAGSDDNDDTTGVEDTGPLLPCPDVFMGPYQVEQFISLPGTGSEDLDFSPTEGVFSVVSDLVLHHVTPAGTATPFSDPLNLQDTLTTGTRYLNDGDIAVAAYSDDVIYRINGSSGALSVLSDDALLDGPNQIVPDEMGNLWVASTRNSSILIIDPADGTATSFISGNMAVGFANGMVVDWDRMMVFWTDYYAGRIVRAQFDGNLTAIGGAQTLTTIPGAFLDGLTMDSCGFLYTVDEGNAGQNPSRLLRVFLDEAGDAIGDAEVIVPNFPTTGLANPRFARGTGWDAYTTNIFVTGIEGFVYRVDVQMEGAFPD